MSEAGEMFREGFEMLMDTNGQTISIFKSYGLPQQTMRDVRGLKNNEKNRLDKVMFQFPKIEDIEVGDVLQAKSSRDLWRVTELEDKVHGDILMCFEAKVEKMNAAAKASRSDGPAAHVVIHGNNFGAMQVASHHSNQTVTVNLTQVNKSVTKLKEIISDSSVSELDKEDAILALERISQLAAKEKSPEVVAKAKEKLELVRSTIGAAVDLSKIAAPYMAMLGEHFAK